MPAPSQKRTNGSSPSERSSDFGPLPAARRCESCLSQYPLQQFRRRRSGEGARVRECRQCHNLKERLRRAGVRHRICRSRMAKAMTRLKNCTAAARVPVFCAEMVQHIGGAEAFLEAWKACIDRDLEKGGLTAFRHLAVLLKFMEHCDPEPVDYSQMSDEELMELAIAAGRG